jgi:cobyrinic acid a,c-diamide synthase
MYFKRPRIIIAALRGGAGKTLLSLGLVAAWREMGFRIAAFKKGPDFIDAGWLAFAAARPCYNLDPFLMKKEQILESFLSRSHDADLSVIEGNRGLYDGLDPQGSCSTAELAKLLKTPVLIVLDVTMATRTVAALVKGCQALDPHLEIAGVILNRVAGSRQEALIRQAIMEYCGIPVVGAVPRLKENFFPERHMGLVPHQERDHAEKAISWSKSTVREHLDLVEIRRIAEAAEDLEAGIQDPESGSKAIDGQGPRVGFIRDRAFWFYYPENLERLEQMGAELVGIDAISQKEIPGLDALYIGGGFPETQVNHLADNRTFRDSLKGAIENGLPVYAECGGFMYLGKGLVVNGNSYPMVGAVPVEFILKKSPQGHGYTVLEVDHPNPYYPVGEIIKGHEFHYSRAVVTPEEDVNFAFRVARGRGVDGERDGIFKKNLLATYTHVHAAGNCLWARGLFRAACAHKNGRFSPEVRKDR